MPSLKRAFVWFVWPWYAIIAAINLSFRFGTGFHIKLLAAGRAFFIMAGFTKFRCGAVWSKDFAAPLTFDRLVTHESLFLMLRLILFSTIMVTYF